MLFKRKSICLSSMLHIRCVFFTRVLCLLFITICLLLTVTFSFRVLPVEALMKMHLQLGFLLSVAWKYLSHNLTARTLVYMQKGLGQ